MTLENIREATDHPKDFVPQEVPRLNYLGSAKARVRKWVQRSLIERIKVRGVCEEMGYREDMLGRFPLIPPTNLTLPSDKERLREAEPKHESTSQQRRG